MFGLKRQTAKVAHLNVREEKHGEESVVAVDVKIQADVGNDFLEALSPGLRAALYTAEGGQLKGMEDSYSVLRFPQLSPLDWETPMAGCVLILHGAKKANDFGFKGAVSKPLRLDAKEGGTVTITFQVAVHPNEAELGALSSLLGRSTKVSLRPGAEPADAGEPELES